MASAASSRLTIDAAAHAARLDIADAGGGQGAVAAAHAVRLHDEAGDLGGAQVDGGDHRRRAPARPSGPRGPRLALGSSRLDAVASFNTIGHPSHRSPVGHELAGRRAALPRPHGHHRRDRADRCARSRAPGSASAGRAARAASGPSSSPTAGSWISAPSFRRRSQRRSSTRTRASIRSISRGRWAMQRQDLGGARSSAPSPTTSGRVGEAGRDRPRGSTWPWSSITTARPPCCQTASWRRSIDGDHQGVGQQAHDAGLLDPADLPRPAGAAPSRSRPSSGWSCVEPAARDDVGGWPCGEAPCDVDGLQPEARGGRTGRRRRAPIGCDQALAAVAGGQRRRRAPATSDGAGAGQATSRGRGRCAARRAARRRAARPWRAALRVGLGGALARGLRLLRARPPHRRGHTRPPRSKAPDRSKSTPSVRRLLGDERGGRHAGLGVDLQKDQNVVNIVITKVAIG